MLPEVDFFSLIRYCIDDKQHVQKYLISKLFNCDSDKKKIINSSFFPTKKLMRKACLSLNYNVTKFHYILLVELKFIQGELDKKAGIFRFKAILKTQIPYIAV